MTLESHSQINDREQFKIGVSNKLFKSMKHCKIALKFQHICIKFYELNEYFLQVDSQVLIT